jgi:hypothetical protein
MEMDTVASAMRCISIVGARAAANVALTLNKSEEHAMGSVDVQRRRERLQTGEQSLCDAENRIGSLRAEMALR